MTSIGGSPPLGPIDLNDPVNDPTMNHGAPEKSITVPMVFAGVAAGGTFALGLGCRISAGMKERRATAAAALAVEALVPKPIELTHGVADLTKGVEELTKLTRGAILH